MNRKSIHQNLMRRALTLAGMNLTRWAVTLAVVMITMFALPTGAWAQQQQQAPVDQGINIGVVGQDGTSVAPVDQGSNGDINVGGDIVNVNPNANVNVDQGGTSVTPGDQGGTGATTVDQGGQGGGGGSGGGGTGQGGGSSSSNTLVEPGDEGGGESSISAYSIPFTIALFANGQIKEDNTVGKASSDPSIVKVEATVTITAIANSGYKFKEWQTSDIFDGFDSYKYHSSFSFTHPGGRKVSFTAVFEVDPNYQGGSGQSEQGGGGGSDIQPVSSEPEIRILSLGEGWNAYGATVTASYIIDGMDEAELITDNLTKESAAPLPEGSTVSLTIMPGEGYDVDEVSVSKVEGEAFVVGGGSRTRGVGKAAVVVSHTDGTNVWSFTMPAYNAKATVTYKQKTAPKKTIESSLITLDLGDGLTYNGEEQKPGVTVTDGGTDITDEFVITYNNNKSAGEATVTVTAKETSTGYTGSETLNFTIARKALTLVANKVEIFEGEALPDFTGSIKGFVDDEGLTKDDVLTFSVEGTPSASGEYAVTGKLNGAASGDYGQNYTFSNDAANATALTIKKPEASETGTAINEQNNSVKYEIRVGSPRHGKVKVPTESEAGKEVKITLTPDDGYKAGKVTVVKKPSEESVNVEDYEENIYTFIMPKSKVKVSATFVEIEDIPGAGSSPLPTMDVSVTFAETTYDGKTHALSVSVPDGATITYADKEDGSYSATAPTFKDVVNTTIYYKVTKEGCQDAAGTVAVKINKKALTVTADDKSMTAGGTEPALTYKTEGLVEGDNITVVLQRAEGNAVGTYDITLKSISGVDNYEWTFVKGVFTIKKAVINDNDPQGKLNGKELYDLLDELKPIINKIAPGLNIALTADANGRLSVTVNGMTFSVGDELILVLRNVKKEDILTPAFQGKVLAYLSKLMNGNAGTRGSGDMVETELVSGEEFVIPDDGDLVLILKTEEAPVTITALTVTSKADDGGDNKDDNKNDINGDGKVNAIDLVKAIGAGKTQAEIDAIVNAIMGNN